VHITFTSSKLGFELKYWNKTLFSLGPWHETQLSFESRCEMVDLYTLYSHYPRSLLMLTNIIYKYVTNALGIFRLDIGIVMREDDYVRIRRR
jgi:hypothetical protein